MYTDAGLLVQTTKSTKPREEGSLTIHGNSVVTKLVLLDLLGTYYPVHYIPKDCLDLNEGRDVVYEMKSSLGYWKGQEITLKRGVRTELLKRINRSDPNLVIGPTVPKEFVDANPDFFVILGDRSNTV